MPNSKALLDLIAAWYYNAWQAYDPATDNKSELGCEGLTKYCNANRRLAYRLGEAAGLSIYQVELAIQQYRPKAQEEHYGTQGKEACTPDQNARVDTGQAGSPGPSMETA